MSAALHVVCSSCDSINRLPQERLGANPRCGKCHQPLFAARPVPLTTARFEAHLRHSDIPLLVDFWAPWCGYCQKMAPAFARAAAELEPSMRLATVDTEAEPGLAARHGIQGLPTILLFRQGRETARQSGAMTAADLVRWARAHL